MKTRDAKLYPYWIAVPCILVYSAFYFVPLIAGLVFSVTDWNSYRFWSPEFNGLDNFIGFFNESNFTKAIKNTFNIAIFTTLFKVVLGLVLALALVRPLRTRNVLRTVFFMPAVLSSVVIGLVFSSIFRMEGLFTHLLAIFGITGLEIDWLGNPHYSIPIIMFTEIWQWSGLAMVVFIGSLQSIPKEYYEAVEIDGAGRFQRFWYITMPMLASAFNFNITIALIGGLRVFTPVFILTNGGPGFETDVLARYIFSTYGNGFYGKAAAISIIQSAMIILISYGINQWMKKKEVEL